jgi:hypothetical protein
MCAYETESSSAALALSVAVLGLCRVVEQQQPRTACMAWIAALAKRERLREFSGNACCALAQRSTRYYYSVLLSGSFFGWLTWQAIAPLATSAAWCGFRYAWLQTSAFAFLASVSHPLARALPCACCTSCSSAAGWQVSWCAGFACAMLQCM